MSALATAPLWQRQRALALHAAFTDLRRRAAAGGKVRQILAEIAARHRGTPLAGGHTFRCSVTTLFRELSRWEEGGRVPAAILSGHWTEEKTASGKITPEFLAEYHRRLTAPTGGRTKAGTVEVATVYKQLCREWADGQWVEGLGDWQHHWRTAPRTRSLPLPDAPPTFPVTLRTLQRKAASTALRKAGNVGAAAARNSLPRIQLDYSKLRRCELYTLDDVRPDLVAIHEQTGKVCDVVAYVMMEVASRCIVAHILKPAAAIRASDVDELLVLGLQADGFGVGVGYTTHIKFERGTVACSEAAKAVLEGGSGGSIKVLRTGMDGTVRWTGQAKDVGSGNAAGKAVIESWMRHGLHSRLSHLPGQRGNNFTNAPANLGFAGNRSTYTPGKDAEAEAERGQKGTLTARADQLAGFARRARELGVPGWEKITYPVLTLGQLDREITAAIAAHNAERGHDYAGHTRILQVQTAPGVWADLHGE